MGWYSTGPKIRPADLDIHELFRRYTPNPVLVIINVKPTEIGLPTKAYLTVEEVSKVPHRLSSPLARVVAGAAAAWQGRECSDRP